MIEPIDARAYPGLTERQRKMLAAIVELTDHAGFPPTRRELCEAMGIGSTSVIAYHLRRLEDAGAIELVPETARGIRVTGGES